MFRKKKFAFVAFYPVLPNTTGSSEVSGSFFKYWPNDNKKFFFITHLQNKMKNKKFNEINIFKEHPLLKIIALCKLCAKIYNFLKTSKNPYLIVEGPSWIVYSYITIIITKFLLPRLTVIYHSHSIEYEIRKKFNNKIISCITFILERKVFEISNYSTSVSRDESKKIYNLYKKNTILFKNGIDLNNIKNISKKKLNYKYIIYTGSYLYKPNKEAINILINKIMPKVLKNHPYLKLIITGGGYLSNDYKNWLIDLGKVSKNKLYYYLKNAECLVTPILYGSGTRIKIIEALCLGTPVITTSIGISGIEYLNKRSNAIVSDNIKSFPKFINNFLRNNTLWKNKDINRYRYEYSMKNLTKNLYNNIIN